MFFILHSSVFAQATGEDFAAGTIGRDRKRRGTITRSKSDENSIQHIRGLLFYIVDIFVHVLCFYFVHP